MLGSLRFRLPAFFLLGVLLAGVIAALISVRFFQSYAHARAVDELRSESVGIVGLYARQAGQETVPYKRLVAAIGGDRIYWVPAFRGSQIFQQDLPSLPKTTLDMDRLNREGPTTFDLNWGGSRYLAFAQPLKLGQSNLFGALVVA